MVFTDINAFTLVFATFIIGVIVASLSTESRNRSIQQQPKSEDLSALKTALASSTDSSQNLVSAVNALRTTIESQTTAQTHATAALSLLIQKLESRISSITTGANNNSLSENNHDNLSVTSNTNYAKYTDDADLYRRKVEAMEGLRRVLEANPGGIGAGEDEVLYRRRVEALEALMRVLDAQPSAGMRGRSRGAAGVGGEEETMADSLGL